MNSKNIKNYIVGIDGCRGLACLGVFIVNYLNKIDFDRSLYFLDYIEISGRFGIVTLIVLSGFGLSIPFWNLAIKKHNIPSIRKFWIRRFLKIIPLYYLCLFALILHNEIWDKTEGWTDIFLHIFFLNNYSNEFYYSINPVFWVLSFFMHFYLLIPILFWFGRRRVKNSLLVISAALIFSYALHIYVSSGVEFSNSGNNNYMLTKSFLAYLPHFLLGTLAGWVFLICREYSWFSGSKFFKWFAFWIFMALLGGGLGLHINELLEFPYAVYQFPATPFIVSLIITSAALGSASNILESKPIKLLALLSYGIFIFHYPIINLTLRFLPKLSLNPNEIPLVTGILALLLTISVSAVT